MAQFSHQTAFILQAEGELGKQLNTGKCEGWKVAVNSAYRPIPVTRAMVRKFYVAGPCDSIIAAAYPWNWEKPGFGDAGWQKPSRITLGVGRGYMHGVAWMLVPRNIPRLEETTEILQNIVRKNGTAQQQIIDWKTESITIPAKSTQTILFDLTRLTIGYPVLSTRGGYGTTIRATYSEALYREDGSKGNRNDLLNKHIEGYFDIFLPDGRPNDFRPLWLRSFRFIELEIQTGSQPLELTGYVNQFTAYPFEQLASFESNDPDLTRIWQVGWHTARLCAGETYMDCPYWEQLQYVGDTRIQALISLYNPGDDRLMRNALELIDQSRIPEGLTLGRAPSFIPQVTPPFSLYWIAMVHDYFMHRSDDEFIRQFVPGIRSVLDWFERRMDSTDLLGPLNWFNFTDWTTGFQVGTPSGADTGHSALLSLNYAYALDRASELFLYLNLKSEGRQYALRAKEVKQAVYQSCWNSAKGLLSDTPGGKLFSQHTNIFGILSGAIPESSSKTVMQSILNDNELIKCTIYYKFYLFRALVQAGMPEAYLDQLQPWKEMLHKGLSTFEEGDYDERSDCHAWGASPNYDLLSIVCGINPGCPGFKTVSITPALGRLAFVNASMPHPAGDITVRFTKRPDNRVTGSVCLPDGVTGNFQSGKTKIRLHSGINLIK